jgi:hypothetical protein
MRVGTNPANFETDLPGYGLHRVIVPVYIPNQVGYFEYALDVLRLCLDSLRLTTHGKAAVTIVTNGCAPEVLEEIDSRQRLGHFDQVVHNRVNRGKIDAVVPVARGAFEPLLTITDYDVLFRPGWIEAIEEVFRGFPECGFVSPFPSPGREACYTSATLLGAIVRRELCFEKVVCEQDLDQFARSINNPGVFQPGPRACQLVIRRNGVCACVGSGHFVCTIRKEVVAAMPREPSLKAYAGWADREWLDVPPDKAGNWRLSTTRAFVQHMGNRTEDWMYEELRSIREGPIPNVQFAPLKALRRDWVRVLPLRFRQRLVDHIVMPRVRRIQSRKLASANAERSTPSGVEEAPAEPHSAQTTLF